MLVSLDQVNTLAKSRYKNYMITIQSVNSMMMEEIANNAGTTDDVDFLHTSAKDVDTIEQYFTFIAVKVIDVEVEKVMLELRLTLAKEDKINNKIKGKDKLVSVCKQLSEPLAKKAEELCKTKFYKNSHFEVGSRIAFIDELQIYNSNFINYLVFVLDNLNIILRENLGINLRIATLAKEDTHCPFDKNINNVLNEAGFTATHIKDFLIKNVRSKVINYYKGGELLNLELVTDLTKIGLEIKVVTDPMESWLSYNLICIPLTKNNKLVGKEYLCDFRNSSVVEMKNSKALITLTKHSELLSKFELNLRDMPEEVNKLAFFLLGKKTGTTIKGLDSINVNLMDFAHSRELVSIEVLNLSWGVKCINLCNFYRKEKTWIFKEISKRIKMDDFCWNLNY